jgi:hypothetical protein
MNRYERTLFVDFGILCFGLGAFMLVAGVVFFSALSGVLWVVGTAAMILSFEAVRKFSRRVDSTKPDHLVVRTPLLPRGGAGERNLFVFSLVFAACFYALVAYMYLDQGGLLYAVFVFPLAAIATGTVITLFLASPPNRLMKLLYVSGGAMIVVVALSVLPLFHGFPVSNYVPRYSCFATPLVNATYPSITYTSTVCSASGNTFSILNALGDLFFWLSISGLVAFGAFSWTRKEKGAYYKVECSLVAAILLTALALLVLGVPTPTL